MNRKEHKEATPFREGLAARGHTVQVWHEWEPKAGAVCLSRRDPATDLREAAADPRRESYALGW